MEGGSLTTPAFRNLSIRAIPVQPVTFSMNETDCPEIPRHAKSLSLL
jgi:hypothetical protein